MQFAVKVFPKPIFKTKESDTYQKHGNLAVTKRRLISNLRGFNGETKKNWEFCTCLVEIFHADATATCNMFSRLIVGQFVSCSVVLPIKHTKDTAEEQCRCFTTKKWFANEMVLSKNNHKQRQICKTFGHHGRQQPNVRQTHARKSAYPKTVPQCCKMRPLAHFARQGNGWTAGEGDLLC